MPYSSEELRAELMRLRPEEMLERARAGERDVLLALAHSDYAPVEVLEYLSTLEDFEVQLALITNTNTTSNVLVSLLSHGLDPLLELGVHSDPRLTLEGFELLHCEGLGKLDFQRFYPDHPQRDMMEVLARTWVGTVKSLRLSTEKLDK